MDIENFCASAIPSSPTVRIAKIIIDRIAKIKPEDAFYVIGSHDGLMKTIATTWPKVDSKGRVNREGFSHSGKDGADRSIVHWLQLNFHRRNEWNRIVLVSGDHFFLKPLRAYAEPATELVQIARTKKSRHHDYTKFGKRITTIFLEDITKTPLAEMTIKQAGEQIDKWFENKNKAHLERGKATKEKLVHLKSSQSKTKKVNVKPKTYQTPASGNLSVNGKEFSPVVWDKEYDWLFDSSRLYLSSNSYRSFREASTNAQIQLVLRDGKTLSAKKTR